MTAASVEITRPLCVDLDGTLIRSDLLLESLMLLAKRNPLYLFWAPFWLLRGKAVFKSQIARRIEFDASALPYNREFLDWLQAQRRQGRTLWLCTASNERLATRVASHLNLFEGVMASDDATNLVGGRKAAKLIERFGELGFDYCGNEHRDLAIWEHAQGAIVVAGGPRLEKVVASNGNLVRTFPSQARAGPALIRALRPHQWAKNMLILVPLLAAHQLTVPGSLIKGLLGVAAFCLCASSVYVVNDLLDLTADRVHPRKCKRPFAAGDLSIITGLILAAALLGSAVLIAAVLPPRFVLVFATYYLITVAYSLILKGRVIVDAMTLAGLYTLRVIAGAAAVSVPLSFWLLLFSVFLFLSLAFVKRYAELDTLRRQQRLKAVGRGYIVADLPVLQSLGSSAGYLSVLVLALYINSPDIQSLYHHPKVIWMLCVLMLYWVSRVWMKAQRGEMHDDPVVFAMKDKISLSVAVLVALTVVAAV
jgi:4-hydroxybenzoate polyprenyltransferase/phosphoserine phosphatase